MEPLDWSIIIEVLMIAYAYLSTLRTGVSNQQTFSIQLLI